MRLTQPRWEEGASEKRSIELQVRRQRAERRKARRHGKQHRGCNR